MWLREAKQENNPYMAMWEALVSMVQLAFREGIVPLELIWTTMILLPKMKGGYKSIGFVEVIWKMNTTIIKSCLRTVILIHDALYRFRQVMGMGTVTAMVEVKLSQQLAGICH